MNKHLLLGIVLSVVCCCSAQRSSANREVTASLLPVGAGGSEMLWYEAPARVWHEALPLGNSRLGAMVYGGTRVEELQLNEETFFSGGPHDNDSRTSLSHLDEVRRLIFEGKDREASAIVDREFIRGPHGMKYLTLGSLLMTFGHENISDYQRTLDLQRAVATTSYTYNGVHYTRTVFTSLADSVLVVNIKASRRGALAFSLRHSCPLLTTTTMSAATLRPSYIPHSAASSGHLHNRVD